MKLQDVVWILALVGMGLVALGFLHVLIQAGKPPDDDTTTRSARTARRYQGRLFAVLMVVFLAGSWATLHRYPIPPQAGTLEVQQMVEVVGGQWYWRVEPSTVQVGQTVGFRVTSADVNHGFAIYAPDGHIVTQTQAMPGYTNTLVHTFDTPGTYTLQCLEYCGLGHAPMHAPFHVVAATPTRLDLLRGN